MCTSLVFTLNLQMDVHKLLDVDSPPDYLGIFRVVVDLNVVLVHGGVLLTYSYKIYRIRRVNPEMLARFLR